MDPYADDDAKRRRRKFFGCNPNIQGWIFLSKEGLPVSSALPRDVNDIVVSAMSAAILSVSERAVKELARGNLKRILIESADNIIILSKAGPNYILCTLTRSGASLGMVFLNIQSVINKFLSGDLDDKDDEDRYFPFPHVFKPPTPPGDLGIVGEQQAKRSIAKEELWDKPYCKNCGSIISEGQAICPVCGKKVN